MAEPSCNVPLLSSGDHGHAKLLPNWGSDSNPYRRYPGHLCIFLALVFTLPIDSLDKKSWILRWDGKRRGANAAVCSGIWDSDPCSYRPPRQI